MLIAEQSKEGGALFFYFVSYLIPRPPISQLLLLGSQASTPRLTPLGSPPSLSMLIQKVGVPR